MANCFMFNINEIAHHKINSRKTRRRKKVDRYKPSNIKVEKELMRRDYITQIIK